MQPGFQNLPLKVSTQDGHNFVLLEPFSFVRPNGEVITVPTDTTSDGASTPPILWPKLPPFGKYWKAAFLHDYLYRCTTRPKSECDTIFNEAMESLQVEEETRITMYEGVHLAGWKAFRDDRQVQNAN